jgi:leader peptidase (prepilin peptidase)/N-methyltransferase
VVTALLLSALAVYGVVIGSFLNVVIHRVPLGQSVVRPPSACPGCGQQILSRDNIPVLSWIALRGKCRNCAMAISARYPLVEVLTGVVFVAVGLRIGWSWTLPAEVVLMGGLVALAFIDFDHMRLPKVIVYPLGGAVASLLLLATAVQASWGRLGVATVCGLAEFALLFTINLVSPRSLGFGDVRLAPVIGLGLGWLGWRYAFWAFFLANLVGAVVGVTLMIAKKAGRRTAIPFGVFLAVGAFMALLGAGSINFPAG